MRKSWKELRMKSWQVSFLRFWLSFNFTVVKNKDLGWFHLWGERPYWDFNETNLQTQDLPVWCTGKNNLKNSINLETTGGKLSWTITSSLGRPLTLTVANSLINSEDFPRALSSPNQITYMYEHSINEE